MKTINEIIQEIRKELFQHQFIYYEKKNKDAERQFWKHDNHHFYLYSNPMIDQRMDYIHTNSVEAGYVNEAHEWRLSSANLVSPIKTEVL